MTIDIGTVQHQGTRDYQEDTVRLSQLDTGALLIVCDGMGGHEGGEVASAIAADVIQGQFIERLAGGMEADAALQAAVVAANESIANAIEDGAPEGMGTTAVAVWATEERLQWVSVGDSPLFRIQGNRVEQLNADHSMAPILDEMAELGRIEADEALADPARNALRSVLDGGEINLTDKGSLQNPFKKGALIIIASDGIETLDRALMAKAVRHKSMSATKLSVGLLQGILQCDAASQDNISIVAMKRKKRSWWRLGA